ncbi:Uncharacterised protein [Enterobacter cloacae]|nr:Uncharacterised protein [Enterobacter cloacae]
MGVDPQQAGSDVVQFRLGVGGYLAGLQGGDAAEQPPDTVGGAFVALPRHQGIGHRLYMGFAESVPAQDAHGQLADLVQRHSDHGLLLVRPIPRVACRDSLLLTSIDPEHAENGTTGSSTSKTYRKFLSIM